MTSKETDAEILRQANELLRLLKLKKAQGKVPTPDSILHIKAGRCSYRLEASIDVLKKFIKKFKAKDNAPRTTPLPGGGGIKKELKDLPRFKKTDFNAWELCTIEKDLGDMF